MKNFIIFSCLIFSTILKAQPISSECKSNKMFGHFYRQTDYKVSSHEEDMILASLGNRYAETLMDKLKLKKLDSESRQSAEKWIKKNCSPHVKSMSYGSKDLSELGQYLTESESSALEACRYQQNKEKFEALDCEVGKIIRKSPVQVKDYTIKFNIAIREYEWNTGNRVYRSKPHQWSKKKKGKLLKKFPAASVMSKLLATLAMGATSRYMMTEHDQELRHWIMSQPMSSLSPEDVFARSLELQEGDIYKALLSIENVLSEYWLTPNRQHLKQTASLKSITNYCPNTPSLDGGHAGARKGLNSDDVFGSWYHLFGTMLLGCVEGPIISTLVGKTESMGGRILDIKKAKKQGHNIAKHLIIGTDPQEEKINKRGGRIGHNICKHTPRNYYKNINIENPLTIDLGGIFNKNKKVIRRTNDCDPSKGCLICETMDCLMKR